MATTSQGEAPNGAAVSPRQIAFLSRHDWPWLRQTDDGAGHHGALTFKLAASPDDDWMVVYDDIKQATRTHLPASRRILFITEPPGQKRYKAAFANQFGVLVSPYPIAGFRGQWVASQPGINWFYGVEIEGGKAVGRLDLTALRNLPVPTDKAKRISVVCSTKTRLARHRARLRLLERLAAAFPNDIDIFGRGFKPIGDKADVIAPYRYHIALENSDCPHFWTEKLADAYLGYALPIFSGCANVTDYFPARSMVRLPDIEDHDGAVRVVGELLETDPWAERLDDIRTARTELIERQNVFSLIERLTRAPEATAGRVTREDVIRPGSECGTLRSLLRPVLQRAGLS